MWTKLGSFRERVREHAKSAAQVAQGVLQAAAAEDEADPMQAVHSPQAAQQSPQDEWDSWDQNGFGEDVPQPPPPPESAPPPTSALAPPPIPDAPPQTSADISARKGTRRSRYVVTGIAPSKPQAPVLAPPVPTSFVTPAHPVTEQKNGFISADESQFASQQALPEAVSAETAPPESDMIMGTDDAHAAEASQSSAVTNKSETVPAEIAPPEPGMFIGTDDAHVAETSHSNVVTSKSETVLTETVPLEPDMFMGTDDTHVEKTSHSSALASKSETIPAETAPLEPDMFMGTDDTHVAEPSHSSTVPNHSEPVSDAQCLRKDAIHQGEQVPQETVGFLDDQPSEGKQLEADTDAFIDWGDDGWNIEDDEQVAIQHEAGEMYSEAPKSLAQETGADVDWFSVKPSKPEDTHSSFPLDISEPPQTGETNEVGAKGPSGGADPNTTAEELLDEPVSQEREPEFLSLDAPEVPQESISFEQEASATFENVGSHQTGLSTNLGAKNDEECDASWFGTHDESQRPPLEAEDNFWTSSDLPDQASLAEEPSSGNDQRVDINVAENGANHDPILREQEKTEAQVDINEAFPVYPESQEQDLGSAYEMEALRSDIQRLREERDRAIATRSHEEQQNEELKRSILTLKDDLERTQDLSESLAREKESLLGNLDTALREKHEAEAERDAAIERGGDGIKEAHHLIEVMRGNEDAAREREAVIAGQIETMRSDIERISSERNSLIHETDDLQRQLQQAKSQAQLQEDQMKQQLQIVSHEREIANLEREKALESIKVHAQEYENLYADERDRLAAMQEKDLRIQELERAVNNREKHREEEDTRIELLSNQIQEMKDRAHDIIEERNGFYQEKLGLENEIESFSSRYEQAIRDLQDAKRECTSLKGERDEARTRCGSMRDQNAEWRKRFESLSSERDRLIQERTAAAASSVSVSDREKNLAQECEQKTRSLALTQRKLTSMSSKMEKLTLQKGTFLRQRDEASARLRAAGEEFMTLHSKLESITSERDSLKTDLARIREERDTANFRVEELSSTAAEHVLVQEKLQAMSEEVEVLTAKLEESRKDVSELLDKESSLKQKSVSLSNELSQVRGRVEVLMKEKESAISQNDVSEQEKTELRERVLQLEEDLAAVGKKAKSLEADLSTAKETSAGEVGIVKAELIAEQKARQEVSGKLATLENDVSSYQRTVADVYDKIRSSLQNSSSAWEQSPLSVRNVLEWPEIPSENQEVDPTNTVRIVSVYSELVSKLVEQALVAHEDYELTKEQLQEYGTQLNKRAEEQQFLQQIEQRCTLLAEELATTQHNLQNASSEGESMRQQLDELTNALTTSKIRESELEEELRVVHQSMQSEIEKLSHASAGEVEQARQELQNITSSLRTIWGMIQKSLGIEHLETFTDDGSEYADTEVQGNLGVHVLRGTASLVAELSRSRSHLEESEQRCQNAENEVERLTERAEIAEQERDAFRGSNERLERKANNSRSEGHEEAKRHYEAVIAQIEDELEDLRHNLERMTDKSERSDKEAGELRALCTKLTSQLNSRTNELDEAEEKNVYLQDQVTTLGEDLEEAHRRLQEHEEESAVAQKEEVERLTSELRESSSELEKTLELCSRLQSTSDEAEAKAKECELLAETHRQAEENLKIAIEQLEAAQDSLVEQRTIELQRKLSDVDAKLNEAKERVSSVNVTENKLKIQDEEIKELRGAIGRLADERVELKLELEKSLSRLNHPDAGGQLVDRRVVRQLLVSYFRVGSVRRRDVLELMSRMLAFSESDNIAVGLKRRALMDRLGSLVQAPELDDASLPPIGTVSDKWIEFLMKETEEGEEQAKGW